jgi:hypothetical protein
LFSLGVKTSFLRALVFTCTLGLLRVTASVAQNQPAFAELIRHPARFDGKQITVTGVYRAGYENSCLFADRRAADRFEKLADSTDYPIWIEGDPSVLRREKLSSADVQNQYVRVTGTFHYSTAAPLGGFGHLGASSMMIDRIQSFRPLRHQTPNHAMELTASGRTALLSMASTLSPATMRALARGSSSCSR